MATYAEGWKTRALDGGLDSFDTGSVAAAGKILLKSSAPATLATITLSAPPSFGATANVGGTIKAVANSMTGQTNPTDGTIATFEVQDRDGTSRVTGTVGLSGSGADMIVNTVTIPPGSDAD